MGLFDKLFKKEEPLKDYEDSAVVAVVTGKRIPTAEISDPVFAEEMMGKTIGIVPEGKKKVVSPVNGKIEVLFPTGHAFGLRAVDGRGYLVHIGVDTVGLNGKGFKALAKQGDTVKAGQPIVEVDFESVKAAGLDPVVMLILTENPEEKPLEYKEFVEINAGDIINL